MEAFSTRKVRREVWSPYTSRSLNFCTKHFLYDLDVHGLAKAISESSTDRLESNGERLALGSRENLNPFHSLTPTARIEDAPLKLPDSTPPTFLHVQVHGWSGVRKTGQKKIRAVGRKGV
jgi:hypothetical protein